MHLDVSLTLLDIAQCLTETQCCFCLQESAHLATNNCEMHFFLIKLFMNRIV